MRIPAFYTVERDICLPLLTQTELKVSSDDDKSLKVSFLFRIQVAIDGQLRALIRMVSLA